MRGLRWDVLNIEVNVLVVTLLSLKGFITGGAQKEQQTLAAGVRNCTVILKEMVGDLRHYFVFRI